MKRVGRLTSLPCRLTSVPRHGFLRFAVGLRPLEEIRGNAAVILLQFLGINLAELSKDMFVRSNIKAAVITHRRNHHKSMTQ